MKKFFFLFLFIAFTAASLFASTLDRLSEFRRQYRVSPSLALQHLTNYADTYPSEWNNIKNILMQWQEFEFYDAFLHDLAPNPRVLHERVNIDLLLGNNVRLIKDLHLSLRQSGPMQIAAAFSGRLSHDDIWNTLSPLVTNTGFRALLRNTALLQNRLESYDRLIDNSALTNIIPTEEVKSYLYTSWTKKSRDLFSLIRTYHLEKEAAPYLLYAYHLRGEDQKLLELAKITADKECKDNGIDKPFLMARAYFRIGDYQKARIAFSKVFFPWQYDLSYEQLRCDIALQDYQSAATRLKTLKQADTRHYWTVWLAAHRGDTNTVVQTIEQSFSTTSEQPYLPEMLLLYYVIKKEPDLLSNTVEMLRAVTLKKDYRASVSGIALAYLSQFQAVKSQQNNPSGDFVRYNQALRLSDDGKPAKAALILKKILLSEKSSTLVRQLAVYSLRRLESERQK